MPLFDQHVNFAITTVATAPSPATTGTSLTVAAGMGALFPLTPPFDVVIWPTSAQPTSLTAEIARCTAIATDTLTITRGPLAVDPGGINRTIVAGDQIQLGDTMKMWTDLEAAINGSVMPTTLPQYQTFTVPAGTQALWGDGIVLYGTLIVNGSLRGVR